MQDRLKVVALSRILAIEQLKVRFDERLVQILYQQVCLQAVMHNKLEEQLVDQLQVRPGLL